MKHFSSMKLIPAIGTLALLVVAMAVSAGSTTINFDPSLVRGSTTVGAILYDTCRAVPVGMGMKLSVLTYYITLPAGGATSGITWKVLERIPIASVDPQTALSDIVTSDDPATEAAALEVRTRDSFGREPVYVIDQTTIGETGYAGIVVFPVTIDDDGRCYLNTSLDIAVDDRLITAAELYPNLPENPLTVDVATDEPAFLATAPVDYLVITSDSLLQALSRLVEYKNSVGITTAVELISEIVNTCDGRDDAERLRERLKRFYENGGQYVLLAGDETMLPLRYAYPYSTSEPLPISSLQICDLYFADLTGEWDVDDDGIWGEKYVDAADLTPELIVGRLPFNTPSEVDNYIDKLISYETNPGNGQSDYLTRAFFFSSDQMRDYIDGGQHHYIAMTYPGQFQIDTVNGVELASGGDPEPYNLAACFLEDFISEGYGIINVIAHGANDAFGVKTTLYNEWPKSYFMSRPATGSHGDLTSLQANHRVSLYYSLACSNGGFDQDQPPYDLTTPNMVQTMLGLADAGAVAFVANSRWGWVSSSYLFQAAFFESLFEHPGRTAPEALNDAKARYPFYTDQVYGLNYHGDPTLKVYTETPGLLSVTTSIQGTNLNVTVSSSSGPVDGCELILSRSGEILSRVLTGNDGRAVVTQSLEIGTVYTLAALKGGYAIGYLSYEASTETAVEDQDQDLPRAFELSQNYPNPFNPSTTIRLQLARLSHVTVTVYNLLGQVVSILKDESLPAGSHDIVWHGDDLAGNPVASGVYFYRAEVADITETKKMVLLR